MMNRTSSRRKERKTKQTKENMRIKQDSDRICVIERYLTLMHTFLGPQQRQEFTDFSFMSILK